MSADEFDPEIERLFARSPQMSDAALFTAQVEQKLQKGSRVRFLALGLAGVIGGVVAVRETMSVNLGSGEGVVAFMGRKGGYGNVVILKHDNGISTVYGHLSRFSDLIRKGSHVSQGDIIGYVGMTGLATGPHLHYEFLVDGIQRDPMQVALPTSIPVDQALKPAFDKQVLNYMARLAMLKQRTQLASNH